MATMTNYDLGNKSYPYSYTKCFLDNVDIWNDPLWLLGIMFFITVIIFETLTLPIYPLIFRMHKSEIMHKGF